ncbi:hypothetical protein P1J78_23670 [Psychromarinibacter sp. C21-152]|uniref:Uncharacterized protein n=1 Tax=Psychromarinibacter sediminicola TaxID=3033385 RepID=A0AAE3TAH2_9RHOB|nr:hypothetical protein [Psychromarinibacter sediminicola]MDF0603725.1 hypothetical protein [Psychromarinibacter sediminicola]
MAEVHLPLSITYETEGVTPVADVITALQATDALVKDASSLLPSLIEGLQVEKCSLNVRSLTQESPLREIFFISLFLAFQDDLEREVSSVLEDLFNITVSDDYDTLVTVALLAIAFYGVGLAIDTVKKTFADSLPREKFEELVQVLAAETGKPAADIRSIIHARFGKPAAAKRLVRSAKGVFLPSQRDKNAPMMVDRDRISSEVIREIPYPGDSDQEADFDRYTPHEAVPLELHAQDRDRSATGWAAVAPSISESRLKVRVIDPVKPSALWGHDKVVADVVVVSKLTANGYTPTEIQITDIVSLGGDGSDQSHPRTE